MINVGVWQDTRMYTLYQMYIHIRYLNKYKSQKTFDRIFLDYLNAKQT